MSWYKKLMKYPEALLLCILALFTRLWQLGSPASVVFDEVYFRNFASHYMSGHYFFDIHPPLIKLAFAGVGSLLHFTPEQVARGDVATIALRLLPALAGAALVPMVYVIIRQLGLGRRVAAFGATLILLDNALLVESRFVLMDCILLLSGLTSCSIYLALRRNEDKSRLKWLILLGISLGILVSTKWSGLAVFGLIGLLWVIDVARSKKFDIRAIIYEFLVVSTIVIFIYISSFVLHFSLLTKSGEGDAYMSEKFQATLVGNPRYNQNEHLSFLDKFIELNQQMYSAQSSLNGTSHPYASQWYTWPIMLRPVYYWQGSLLQNGSQGHIYLVGNPAVWALGTIGMLCSLAILRFKSIWLGKKKSIVILLLTAYAANFIPFSFIDRPMFLYHYFFALIISIVVACVLLDALFQKLQKKHGTILVNRIYWTLIIIVVGGFLFFLPLSYGWPLSQSDLENRFWLPEWR